MLPDRPTASLPRSWFPFAGLAVRAAQSRGECPGDRVTFEREGLVALFGVSLFDAMVAAVLDGGSRRDDEADGGGRRGDADEDGRGGGAIEFKVAEVGLGLDGKSGGGFKGCPSALNFLLSISLTIAGGDGSFFVLCLVAPL